MRTVKTLKPGQDGTKELLKRFGPTGAGGSANRQVAPRIGGWERHLHQQVKSAGGQWYPVGRVWFLRRDVVEGLDLLSRVVGGGG